MKTLKNFLALVLITTGFYSCQKDEDVTVPVLLTTGVSNLTQITAISGGNISADGGATITARGVCWNTAENPTINDNKTTDGQGSGEFSSNMTGLTPNTTYYVRAYATNSAGTGYGEAISFTTQSIDFGSFTDPRDEADYQTVTIGNQVWMAENLRYLPAVVGPETGSDTTPYYYVNGYDGTDVSAAKATDNYASYGVLYNWPAAMAGSASSNANPSGVQGVCPTGWHLPSHAEWTQLTDYLGGLDVAGGKMKATGTIEAGTGLWHEPNTGATNETGFTILPGGWRHPSPSFLSVGEVGGWFSASTDPTNHAYIRSVYNISGGVDSYPAFKELGFSIRCLKDE
ncbi:MAG: hypothetical protein K0B37_18170 [Bacteroidales bacterium]|nr:hypothetical protein [Bacteroidales bacterium]